MPVRQVKNYKHSLTSFMKAEVRITRNFKKEAKALIKKYPSFLVDLEELEAELLENPHLGVALGNNIYKIRLRIKSKRKGKSGGARAISFIENELIGILETLNELIVVNLISVYDKSDKATISDTEIKDLIENMEF